MRRETLSLAGAGLIGVVAYLTVVGHRTLLPTNVGWLGEGDPATHYLGWVFFVRSAWTFPVGLNPDYGLELSNSVVYSDSLPLFALPLKVFAGQLTDPFQYFGIWLLVCFVAQALAGALLTGLYTRNPILRLMGAGFFVFSPPMLVRLLGHLSLCGHFLVVLGLYLALRRDQAYRAAFWCALIAVAALVHAYLLVMISALWLADLATQRLRDAMALKAGALEICLVTMVTGLIMWQAGYFEALGAAAGGYGYYRMNLLSPIDPSGWSYLMADIPEHAGEYEGFNYFGLGALLLICIASWNGMRDHDVLLPVRRHAPLLILLIGFVLFALSYKVGIADWEIVLHPRRLTSFAENLRASGRMFWPVFYLLLAAGIVVTIRGVGERRSIALLAVLLAIQIVDTSAGWTRIRAKYMVPATSILAENLRSPFWNEFPRRYVSVRAIAPANAKPNWLTFASYAERHAMSTQLVYLARVSRAGDAAALAAAQQAVHSGEYRRDSIYIVDENMVQQVARTLKPSDALGLIDGFYVVAPGWKSCADCPPMAGEDEARTAGLKR